WHEYAIRFVLGGLATVGTGAIASLFGPQTGGLFLAFPAIFCASATLIEKLERERKERAGVRGARRGKEAAALDAAGAALGSLGELTGSESLVRRAGGDARVEKLGLLTPHQGGTERLRSADVPFIGGR